MKNILFLPLSVLLFLFVSCKENNDIAVTIEADSDSLVFSGEGGKQSVRINMNGARWTVSSDQEWCTTLISQSTLSYVAVEVTAAENPTGIRRSALLTFIADLKDSVTVRIVQSRFYPDYSSRITPDATGMSHDAMSIAAAMFAGWNLGNSLEVPGSETGWGNPPASQTLIDSVRRAGINAIRLPCAWDSHIEDPSTCRISLSWLQRVKQVIDYCYSNDMYVILNIHWDGGWLEENPTYAKQVSVNAKQKALWEQIAVFFRDYDEHLLFAGTNEVHGSALTPTAENYVVQLSYNQTFVNAVRSTGGKNSFRNLVIQAYNTNIDAAVSHLVLPADEASKRLMVEVHYYDPWEFTGLEADASWATVKYLWGVSYAVYGPIASWGQENYVQSQFQKMKSTFIDNGFPVILGEFGATRRSALTGATLENHLASRAYYYRYIAHQAKTFGLVPFAWDNGSASNLGCGIFNRQNGAVFDKLTMKEYMAGVSSGTYPF